MGSAINLRGKRFGKVLAIKPTSKRKANGEVIWECRCDCGKTFYAGTGTLRYGTTQSCGCSHHDNAIYNTPAKKTRRKPQRTPVPSVERNDRPLLLSIS